MSSCRVIRVSPKTALVESTSPLVTPVTWDTFVDVEEDVEAASRTIACSKPDEAAAVARQESERVLAEAREEANRVRQTAYEEGYEQGVKLGRETAEKASRQTLDAARERAEAMLAEAKRQQEVTLRSLQEVITDVVMASVETLLHTPRVVDRADVMAGVSELLEAEVRGSHVEVRLHPKDLQAEEPDVLSELEQSSDLSLKADHTLTRGGFVIETEAEEIDATVETRLELLRPKVQQLIGGLLDERTVGVPGGM